METHGIAATGPDRSLGSLFGTRLGSRYCAWLGASGRRYVVSVYPVDDVFDDGGLPGFEGFVLISVAHGGTGRRVLAVTAIEGESDRKVAIAAALRQGVREWHVHLLAAETDDRRLAVADLAARYDAKGPFSA